MGSASASLTWFDTSTRGNGPLGLSPFNFTLTIIPAYHDLFMARGLLSCNDLIEATKQGPNHKLTENSGCFSMYTQFYTLPKNTKVRRPGLFSSPSADSEVELV